MSGNNKNIAIRRFTNQILEVMIKLQSGFLSIQQIASEVLTLIKNEMRSQKSFTKYIVVRVLRKHV